MPIAVQFIAILKHENKNGQLSIAVTTAVLLHVVLFLWVYWSDGGLKWQRAKQAAKPKPTEPSVVMSLHIQAPPKPVAVVKKVLIPTPPKEAPKYVRTDASQPQGEAPETSHIGAHDTLAQSNAAATKNAPDRPATKGEKRDDESTLATNYHDGEKTDAAVAAAAQSEIKAANTPKPPAEEKAAARQEKKEFIDAAESVVNELRGEIVKPEVSQPGEGSAEREKKRLSVEEARKLAEELELRRRQSLAKLEEQQRKEQQAKKATKAGFSPATKASERFGSISRNGTVSSHNTKATPTGRYTAAVIDSVAKEWYRRCSSHRDLLVPGMLTVRWFVDDNGQIKHLSIIDERLGGEIQKGITVQSINSAHIPKMPNDVRKELNGDPIKIQINFEF